MNNPIKYNDPSGKFVGSPAVSWVIKRILSTVINKQCNDGPIANDDEEIRRMYDEAKKREEDEKNKCGVVMSCNPNDQVPNPRLY